MKTKFTYTTDDRLELLRRLVEINSGTKNISGVNQVQRLLRPELNKIGFTTSLIPNPKGPDVSGELLLGTIAGKSPKFITFVTHADTVFEPRSTFQKFLLSEEGNKAVGPGVIDDKGGIVVAMKGIAKYLSSGQTPLFSLRFLCAPSEETGSHGFWESFAGYGKDSIMVLGFEPSLDNGSIIESRRGNRWYHIEVEGKEGHAGRAHRQGINAGHELAIKLDELQRLTDYKKDVTVSISSLSGGTDKYNVICGHAEAKIDARFSERKAGDKLHAKIVNILKKVNVRSADGKKPSKTKFRVDNDCPAFSTSSQSVPLIKEYLAIVKKIEGKGVKSEPSGGAADANGMSRDGLIIIDGLGASGGGMHTLQEFVKVSSLYTRAEALAQFLSHSSDSLVKK